MSLLLLKDKRWSFPDLSLGGPKRPAQDGREHRVVCGKPVKGWATYYRSVVATETFQACDHTVVQMLLWWGRRRHRNKSVDWTVKRYWHHQGNRRWVFTSADGATLRCHSDTAIKRHVKVRGTASPFDGHLAYWAQRLRHHPLTSTTLGYLLRRQGGACARCGLVFRSDDCIEIDHVTPIAVGGADRIENLQALHRHCHSAKTAQDESRHSRAGGYA